MRFSKKMRGILVVMVAFAMLAGMSGNAYAALSGSLKIGGSTTVTPVAVKLKSAFVKINKGVSVTINETDSGEGRSGAMSGKYGIGMSSSKASSTQINDGLKEYTIAKDALTFIVHPTNKVKGLTKTQLQQIFKGQITNWNQVGGKNAKIQVYLREAGSGTGDYAESSAVLATQNFAGTAKIANSNGLVKAAVAKDKNGIGYVGMAYAGSKVRGLKVNGIAPTRTNGSKGIYPFVRPLYFYTMGTPSNIEKAFIDYTLSSKGQALVNTVYIKR